MKKNKGILFNTFIIVLLSALLSNCNKEDQQPLPSISSFAPASGFTGSQVTISGQNFSDNTSDVTVQFNGINAVVSSSSKTELIVTVPSGATTGKVTISVNGKTATSANDFTVLVLNTITSFSPAYGVEGSSVTITGANFDPIPANNLVKFNGTVATVTEATTTSLSVTVPAGVTTGNITVTVNGQTATSASSFTVLIPSVTHLSPATGATGTFVTITGTNFDEDPANNVVKFNGTVVTVTDATTTSLVTSVPAGATTGTITVTVFGNSATSPSSFTVVQPCVGSADLIVSNLVITSISNNNELEYTIDITNVGDASADLTKMAVQAKASTDAAGNNFVYAGGTVIGGAIAPPSLPSKQTVQIATSSNVVGNGTYDTYLYLVISIGGTVAECSAANNNMIISVH
jgi:hypothetical protein